MCRRVALNVTNYGWLYYTVPHVTHDTTILFMYYMVSKAFIC